MEPGASLGTLATLPYPSLQLLDATYSASRSIFLTPFRLETNGCGGAGPRLHVCSLPGVRATAGAASASLKEVVPR